MRYTQDIAIRNLAETQRRRINVSKVYFDYNLESWMPEVFELPYFNGDYIILTPTDILTKDENWINLAT